MNADSGQLKVMQFEHWWDLIWSTLYDSAFFYDWRRALKKEKKLVNWHFHMVF